MSPSGGGMKGGGKVSGKKHEYIYLKEKTTDREGVKFKILK
jgi:hypothetical protein